MKSRPSPAIRHCPICGIAMLASRSRPNLVEFDTFQCLACETTISESKSRRDEPGKPQR